ISRLLVKKQSPRQRSFFMRRSACYLAILVVSVSSAQAMAQDKKPESSKKLANGVYAVVRESTKEKEVLPLKDGEALVIHNHRYLKKDEKEPPRFLVVRSAPDVDLDLAGEPKAEKEGTEV